MRRLQTWAVAVVSVMSHSALAQSIDAGITAHRKGNIAEARQQLESVIKREPKNAEAYFRLGLLLLDRRVAEVDRAVECMEEAVKLAPTNADYHYGYGSALGMKAQRSNALKQAWLAPKIKSAFEKAVELDPQNVRARAGLVEYYFQAPGIMGGDKKKAWQETETILRIDEFQGRMVRMRMFAREQKMKEAEQEVVTLTTRYPNDWRGWKTSGYFYLRNGRVEQALEPFRKYVELRPDTADSYDSLAEWYLRANEFDKAIEALQRALALDGEFFPSLEKLGRAYEARGNRKDAREAYQRLLALEGDESRRKNLEKKIKELQ